MNGVDAVVVRAGQSVDTELDVNAFRPAGRRLIVALRNDPSDRVIRESLSGDIEKLWNCADRKNRVQLEAILGPTPLVVDIVEKADPSHLDLSRAVLREHGNMSSPTLLFILDRLHASRRAGPYVAIGFGPGLAAEATLLE